MGEDRLSVIIRGGTEDDIEGIRRLEKHNLDNVQPAKALWTALSGNRPENHGAGPRGQRAA